MTDTTVVPARRRTPNAVDIHVGSRVRLRRVLLGTSLENLANRLGLTYQQVQKYEKGENRVSASRLQQIAHILDVPISYFYEEFPRSRPNDSFDALPIMSPVTDAETLPLMKAFARIHDREVRRKVIELVKAISGDVESPLDRAEA